MAKSGGRRRQRNASREILAAAIGLFAMGTVLCLTSVLLASNANPALRNVAKGLRSPVLPAFVIGAVLVAAHWVLQRIRRANRGRMPEQRPIVWFPSTGAAYLNVADEYQAPTHETVVSEPALEVETEWNERVFDQIEWRRFEAVCEALFAQAGFETRAQSHGADGGVDIWLHSRYAEGPVAVVQCKHWHGQPVGVKPVREFFGVMASNGLKRGTFATSSRFTEDALWFAKQNGISALDGAGLLALIATRTPDQQQMLLEVAYEGEYWRPTCANCGIKMVERVKRNTQDAFWGCTNYPRCRATLAKRV
jgi:restriction system protein